MCFIRTMMHLTDNKQRLATLQKIAKLQHTIQENHETCKQQRQHNWERYIKGRHASLLNYRCQVCGIVTRFTKHADEQLSIQ